ncbi:MAG: hypothetical protein JSS11_08960 [Verrucomicrobia bacterium]|nr:hypothetical protein [Verrucomicrobiota bacterium]
MTHLNRFLTVGADEPVRQFVPARRKRPAAPVYLPPAALLEHHHHRVPLRCDRGAIRNNLALAQNVAAQRAIQPSVLNTHRSALRHLLCA